jgi:hypothetical protein
MAGPSKKMRVSDEVFYELLREIEYRDISESEQSSDNEINVNILSCGDEEESVSDSSSMQHGIWANSAAE